MCNSKQAINALKGQYIFKMVQSLSQLYIHIVFSTKKRFPFIKQEVLQFLEEYNIDYNETYIWD